MTIVVEGGSWRKGRRARLHSALLKGPIAISLPRGFAFGMERIASADLASVRLVTEQMRNEAANKVSAGVAGGLRLGPLGLLAGAVIARGERSHLVILEHADGRAALLRCNSAELSKLLALGVNAGQALASSAHQSAVQPPSEPQAHLAARRIAPGPARLALEMLGWLALLVALAVLTTTDPLVALAVSVAAISAGVFVWRQSAFRQRFGRLRAGALVTIGALFFVPVVVYTVAGAPQHTEAASITVVRDTTSTVDPGPPEAVEASAGIEIDDFETRARAEAAAAGLAQAYAIVHDNGTMRDWRSADQLNRTEVAYRLTEKMIMRGNVPRQRASYIELYRCMEAAYAPEVASTSVEEIASACAVTMGWLR